MNHQIITPIYYYIDINKNQIFDIEEIERLFYDQLNELKELNIINLSKGA
jgi:hypothetical protein